MLTSFLAYVLWPPETIILILFLGVGHSRGHGLYKIHSLAGSSPSFPTAGSQSECPAHPDSALRRVLLQVRVAQFINIVQHVIDDVPFYSKSHHDSLKFVQTVFK